LPSSPQILCKTIENYTFSVLDTKFSLPLKIIPLHIVCRSFHFKENGRDQEHQKKTTKVRIASLKRKGIKNTNPVSTPPSFLYWLLALG